MDTASTGSVWQQCVARQHCLSKFRVSSTLLHPSFRGIYSVTCQLRRESSDRPSPSPLLNCWKKLVLPLCNVTIEKQKRQEKMGEMNYTVRVMTKEDVPQTLDVWKATGMQGGTHCLYTWLEVDKEAFHIAVLDSGEVIGVCGAVIHTPNFAFVGIYAVLEKYRGYGIGKKVWDACMEHVGSRNAALNAVPDKLILIPDKLILYPHKLILYPDKLILYPDKLILYYTIFTPLP
ncbi:n-acetyltransferase domain-containing protein [Caerostris darwini]|uniref:N-acetyltransferase domain-containing protein n=1 Tax=Caerostris darwini TaxID=1538125 RepID=A0AAV4W2N0_9ARAC|nr:n-acetyltransferase domain-containing protein [Caerostris darwini]